MRQYVLAVAAPVVSATAGSLFLAVLFGPQSVLQALRGTNYVLVVAAFIVGAVIEMLRAERAAIILRQYRPISFWQSFSTMVVSNGLGDLVPFGPTGVALRPVLTYRVVGIPIAVSAGVFLSIAVFDILGVLPLVGYLLLGAPLHAWQRMLISGTLGPMLLFLLVPVFSDPLRRFLQHATAASRLKWGRQVVRVIGEVTSGLAAVVSAGFWPTASALGLSFFGAGLAVVRLELLLRAVGLSPELYQLLFLMVISWLFGSLPIRIPGTGTWAAAKMLHMAGIAGSGSGGFVLVTRIIASTETPILALGVVIWWILSRGPAPISLSDLRALVVGRSGATGTATEPISSNSP